MRTHFLYDDPREEDFMSTRKLFFILAALSITLYCGKQTEVMVEDTTKDILLENFPDKGVFSLRVQGAQYNPDETPECNPSENKAIQLICDAEASCTTYKGSEKLVCMHSALKVPIRKYKKSLNDDDDRKKRTHNTDFAAWKDLKKVYNKLNEFVNEYRETDDDEGEHENKIENITEEIREIIELLQAIKDKYNPSSDLKILIEVASVELRSPAKGWVKISTDELEVDFAPLNLNRIIAIEAVDPGQYDAVRINFAEQGVVRYAPPSSNTTGEAPSTYPLVFEEQDPRSRTIQHDIPVTRSKAIDLALRLDIQSSVTQKGDLFYFNPAFSINGTSGDEFTPVDQPAQEVLDNGNVVVNIEAGALDQPVRFEAAPLTQKTLPQPVQGDNPGVLLAAYEMKPDMVFKKAVKVELKYDPALLAQNGLTPQNIRARYFHKDRNQWVYIPNLTIDETTNTATVLTNHFTIIAIDGTKAFNLSYKNGVAAKIHYSGINYIIEKGHAVNPLILQPEDMAISVYGDGIYTSGNFHMNELDSRHFKFSVSSGGAPNTIGVRVKVTDYTLGQVDLTVVKYGSTSICSTVYESCAGNCTLAAWLFKLHCHAACLTAWGTCQAAFVHSTIKADVKLSNLDLKLNYEVKRDSQSGVISVTYKDQGSVSFDVTADNEAIRTQVFIVGLPRFFEDLLAQKINEQIKSQLSTTHNLADKIVKEIGNGEEGSLSKKIETEVNTALADTVVEPGFTLDNAGIEVISNIHAYIPELQFAAGNCNVNLGTIKDVQIQNFPLPSESDLGMGFSLTALNQVFTALANRGYFCYDYEVDPATSTFISLQPTAIPQLKYLGNFIMRLRLPVQAGLSIAGIPLGVKSGSIDIYYRLPLNMGGNELRVNAVKVVAHFNDPALQSGANILFNALNADMLERPNLYGYSVYLSNPMNYAKVQHSMFRLNMLEEINGMLAFGIKLGGLELDYENPGGGSEWIWTKNWRQSSTQCEPKTTGIVLFGPAGSYVLLLDSGQTLPLEPMGDFQPVPGSRKTYGGYCSIDPASNTLKYYASNVINDQFYVGPDGFPKPKQNYAAQVINEFDTTVGLYSVNIAGDQTPEILQVQLLPGGDYQLDWIISNTCCEMTPTDVIKHTMTLPPEFNPPITVPPGTTPPPPEGLYRVEVLKSNTGYDQVLFNCYVYDVSVISNQVHLTLVNRICQDPFAGMVIDDPNKIMWSRCSVGQQKYDPGCVGAPSEMPAYENAAGSCENFELGGFADWRLPTLEEYQIIADPAPGISMDQAIFPNTTGMYWAGQTMIDRSTAKSLAFEYCNEKALYSTINIANCINSFSNPLSYNYVQSYTYKTNCKWIWWRWTTVCDTKTGYHIYPWEGNATGQTGLAHLFDFPEPGASVYYNDFVSAPRCNTYGNYEPYCHMQKKVRCVRSIN